MKTFRLMALVLLNLVILSSAIFAIGVRITPDEPTTNDKLMCNILGASREEASVLEYNWYRNGMQLTEASNTLSSSRTSVDDVIICYVTDFLGSFIGSDSVVIFSEIEVIENHEPTVDITDPSDGSEFSVYRTVSFLASGRDPDRDDLTYSWNFGDGTTGTGSSATHSYNNLGTYTVTVRVNDGRGGTDSDSIMIRINPLMSTTLNQEPIAIIDVSDRTVAPEGNIVFDGSRSYDPDGNIVSYEWDFDDGTSASEPVVTHRYSNSGFYVVRLTVTDNRGATSTEWALVWINSNFITSNEPPVADAGSDKVVNVGDIVEFDGSSSYDSDGNIVNYKWNLEGRTTTTPTPLLYYIFGTPGEYIVILTITDNDGATDTDSVLVVVNEEVQVGEDPVAVIDVDSNNILVGESLRFDGSGSYDPDGNIVNYEWDFGDGTSATGPRVEHEYNEEEKYQVTLTVVDNEGNRDAATVIITVDKVPSFNRERRNVNPNVELHGFNIGRISPLEEGPYSAGQSITLFVKLTNEFGIRETLDLVVTVPELDYRYTINSIELDSSEVKFISVPLAIRGNALDGTYFARLTLKADDNENDANKLAYWQFIVA